MAEYLDANISGEELLEAQAHVWSYSFSYIVSMALKCAVELGVPDAIHRHSAPASSLPALVSSLQLDPSKTEPLRRLMRLLVHAGFFTATTDDAEVHYSLTTATKLLLRGQGGPASAFLLLQLDPKTITSWGALSAWFQFSSNPVPYEAGHGGVSFWECMEKDPRQKKAFYDAMVGDSKLVAGVLVSECGEVLEGVESLVDVGGGTGAMAVAIAKAFPKVKCTVFDLPHVVANLKEGRGDDVVKGLENLEVAGGSMFEKIPHADAILLKWILHNWNDEKCVDILKCCLEAVSGDGEKKGKVIIIDMVVGNKAAVEKQELYGVQLCFDLLMLASYNGKERDEKEWETLFKVAGFSGYKIVGSLGPRSIIEAYP
ncbi:unnamed protein product [Linum tenue]|uniref:Uncharacterized protein n=1 Tax=Linum tenue TaxID=586396 RepID=A0AAV0NQU3_9ROSI|nr:unnamed protein product [Linum tenue]